MLAPAHRSLLRLARAHRGLSRRAEQILGVPAGASRAVLRERYYQLAKETHPDTATAGADGASFVAVRAAFEELLEASASSPVARTAPNTAARGGASQWASSPPRAHASAGSSGGPSLGEVLCERLREEPEAARVVWEDLRSRRLRVSPAMADALFRACARAHADTSDGMRAALGILREATALGMVTHEVRADALVSLLTWCKEDELDCTFEVCDEIGEDDRTPEVLAALSATFSFFPSGASF